MYVCVCDDKTNIITKRGDVINCNVMKSLIVL